MNLDCLNSPTLPRIGCCICALALCMILYDKNSASSTSTVVSARKENDSLPPWTNYPRTRFTDHVLELIDDLNASASTNCGVYVNLTVTKPYSIPSVECFHEFEEFAYWCRALKRIFATKHLPYNATIGVKILDKFDPIDADYGCIGSSSPDGMLTMPNLEVMVDMNLNANDSPNSSVFTASHIKDVPWEERARIPIFRGTAWFPETADEQSCLPPQNNISQLLLDPRFHAVSFSSENPLLLDAKFSGINPVYDCFANNATNGLDALLPVSYIKWEDYFSSHQVALVLPGIGAAFRLSTHLFFRNAVILQEWKYQEWFTKYLTPFVDYIPLARDMSNLKERLLWILEHPKEVRAIAENGRIFWETYLTYTHNDEHIHELVYRLSEKMIYHDNLMGQ